MRNLLVLFLLVVLLFFLFVIYKPDGLLHVVFCDVGQGDGALVEIGYMQLVIDGGIDEKILICLDKHMPFWDRKIEMVIMTHPQADHMNGLIHVLKRYKVENFFAPNVENNTTEYKALKAELLRQNVLIKNLHAGDALKFAGVRFDVVWPTREWESKNSICDYVCTSDMDLNGFGISGRLSYGKFDVQFTADADIPIEPEQMQTGLLRDVEILKVPHHGSKTGMLPEWLDSIMPEIAVISVGKNNDYGHPTKEALNLLMERNIKVLRTDLYGSVEVVSDGNKYWNK